MVESCYFCKKLLWKKTFFCSVCLDTFSFRDFIFREIDGLPVFSLFHYVDRLGEVVRVWKMPQGHGLTSRLALFLAKKFSHECLLPIEGVIPMPARKRGNKDHAASICEVLASYFNVPMYFEFLERVNSDEQKKKTLQKRFDLKMKLRKDFARHNRGGLWLLVDDVITSGGTFLTAWNLLGRPQAIGLTLASTPRLFHCPLPSIEDS